MALAQLASTAPASTLPAAINPDFAAFVRLAATRFHDAIRAVAMDALDGEDIDERIGGLAFAYGIDPLTVGIQVQEQIDLLSN